MCEDKFYEYLPASKYEIQTICPFLELVLAKEFKVGLFIYLVNMVGLFIHVCFVVYILKILVP